MKLIKLRYLRPKPAYFRVVLVAAALAIFVSCGDNQESAGPSSLREDGETFTFFGLGKTTRLTDSVRDDLNDKLGRDAIERRSILDLAINHPGFLQKYFPQLEALNQKLNSPAGERVEHNTTKLMFRYARNKNVPFNLVELVFSDYTRTPLLFKINYKVDEANTVETLRQKYGPPEIIEWNEKDGRSVFWRKNDDLLILSRIPDRFGHIRHQIVIYYVENLKHLIETETKEKEKAEQQRAKTGRKAF